MSIKLWNRAGLAMMIGLVLFGWLRVAGAQDRGSAGDIQTSCAVSGIPPVEQISVTWTGDCVDGKASGVGTVFAFGGGELRYILRGQFTDGRLTRQDQLRQCAGADCQDQIAAAVLREHAALGRKRPSADSVAAPAPVIGTAPGQVEIRGEDAVYRGNFEVDRQSGRVSGEGRAEFFDGRVFSGKLVNGNKEGRCSYLWADGQRYEGEWRNDLQDGSGEWTSAKGERYVGQYRSGKREGKGVMTYANKMEYSGEWLADQPTGRGTIRFANGDVYEGQVIAAEQSGTGTLTDKDGNRYTGQWLRGERDGRGIAVWNNGQRYEGEWQHNRKHGMGTVHFADGGSYDGQWRDDRATGQGSMTFASGDSYVGDVQNGTPQGKGVYKWGSGDRFEGEFEAGKPTANGIMTFRIDTTPIAPAEPTAPPLAAATEPGSVVVSRATLCSRAYNGARGVIALRRFMEVFPDDECQRHTLARQKIAVIEENERKLAREQEERALQAKALVGLVVAYRQEYPFCAVGSGSNCQRVLYQFDVKGKIRSVDLARQSVQVQVVDVVMLGNDKGASAQLFAQGRLAANEAFRASVLGTTQWKSKADVGLAF